LAKHTENPQLANQATDLAAALSAHAAEFPRGPNRNRNYGGGRPLAL